MNDSRSPAAGVKVAPWITCGQDKVTGLSMAQAKAIRNTNPLTPHHLRGGCYKQTGACFARTIKGTRSPFLHRTPGRKGPSQGVKKKVNPICRNPIASTAVRNERAAMDMDRVRENAFKRISQQHAGMLGAGMGADVKLYDERRMMFLEKYPAMKDRLDEREAVHRQRIVVGFKSNYRPRQNPNANHRSVVGRVRIEVQSVIDARRRAASTVKVYAAEPRTSYWVR